VVGAHQDKDPTTQQAVSPRAEVCMMLLFVVVSIVVVVVTATAVDDETSQAADSRTQRKTTIGYAMYATRKISSLARLDHDEPEHSP
jgi:hypothetical protein